MGGAPARLKTFDTWNTHPHNVWPHPENRFKTQPKVGMCLQASTRSACDKLQATKGRPVMMGKGWRLMETRWPTQDRPVHGCGPLCVGFMGKRGPSKAGMGSSGGPGALPAGVVAAPAGRPLQALSTDGHGQVFSCSAQPGA